MRTPERNPEGYKLSSVLAAAGKRNFVFMPYASARHGVGGAHPRALREAFIRDHP